MDVMQHNYKAVLAIWNAPKLEEPFVDNFDVSKIICKKYNKILNFCCGYGLTARDALEAGKRFICSDVNPRCVYYIATQYMGYKNGNKEDKL